MPQHDPMASAATADADTAVLNPSVPASDKPLTERAYPGLHSEILQHLLATLQGRGALLDLACGTGAWLHRLRSHGFEDTLGVDGAADAFALDSAGFMCLDLDRPFADKINRRFDVITAIEIIEHIENPTGFLREARGLIKQDGFMFVTTPNVECIQGRLRFLLQGKLRAFEDDGTGDPTHISPLLSSLLPRLTERAGWKIEARYPLLCRTSRPSVRALCSMLSPFMSGQKEGDCHLFVLRPC